MVWSASPQGYERRSQWSPDALHVRLLASSSAVGHISDMQSFVDYIRKTRGYADIAKGDNCFFPPPPPPPPFFGRWGFFVIVGWIAACLCLPNSSLKLQFGHKLSCLIGCKAEQLLWLFFRVAATEEVKEEMIGGKPCPFPNGLLLVL